MSTILLSLLIGAVSGLVAALCGVGGGIIMVPALVYFFGLSQKVAVATSLGAIVLIAIAGTLKNHHNDLVDWKVALACAIAGAIVAWFGADLLKTLSNETLTRGFAVLLIVVGVRMLFFK
jgi:uncharacterized membrane protein YfcA